MADTYWNDEAKAILKSVLGRNRVSQRQLVARLKEIGVDETYASVVNKVNRGTFSAAFMIQCLRAIDCKELSI